MVISELSSAEWTRAELLSSHREFEKDFCLFQKDPLSRQNPHSKLKTWIEHERKVMRTFPLAKLSLGRHSSVVSSAPTICSRRFKSQAHTIYAFLICIIEIIMRKGRKSTKRGLDWPIFKIIRGPWPWWWWSAGPLSNLTICVRISLISSLQI